MLLPEYFCKTPGMSSNKQEEDAARVKYGKSKRGRALGILVVVVILVGGVIASAVLVPLILTNDFIALTGTFQKYSVSSLRRAHSGNHIVVIAKKPHGWNASHSNNLHPYSHQKHNFSSQTKDFSTLKGSFTNNKTNAPMKNHEGEIKPPKILDYGNFDVTTTAPSLNIKKANMLLSTLAAVTTQIDPRTRSTKENVTISAKTPIWYQQSSWSLMPLSFVTWSKKNVIEQPLLAAICSLLVVSFIIIFIAFLAKKKFLRKKVEKSFPRYKEDKTQLLKASTRGSDED